MRFQLLGPVRVWRDDTPIRIGSVKQRSLVAALLLEPNRTVPVERLIDMIWDADPPVSAVANVRTYASRLRHTLVDDAGEHRLVSHGLGYRLAIHDDEFDLATFHRLAQDGRAALAVGQRTRAVELLGQAVGLWQGTAGEDIDRSGGLDRRLAVLDEQRLAVVEDWIEAKQCTGETAELVADLWRLAHLHPLRERLWAQLALALYQTGDVAGSLLALGEAREALLEGLGIDLGPRLVQLHQAVLRRDPSLEARDARPHTETIRLAVPSKAEPVDARPVPRELPVDAAVLIGRGPEQTLACDTIAEHSVGIDSTDPDGPIFIAIHGPTGVGKSALAVRVATRLSRDFPDGQIYVDLRGTAADKAPRRPVEVLTKCLRSLQIPDFDACADEEELAARYRTAVANRRLLVVLEDAADEAQVQPLLTATPGSAVIITSVHRLAVHDRTVHIGLGPLTFADSVNLLVRICDPGSDPRLIGRIARECAGSPRALRLAAVATPHIRPGNARIERRDAPRADRSV